MRTAFLAVAVGFMASTAGAQPAAPYISADGMYAVKFPGKPKVALAQTTRSALGDLTVNVATFATADANVYLVSYTDFPAGAVKPENRKTLFDGVAQGVKGKGEIVSEKDTEFGAGKLPAREVVVDQEKGKQRVKFLVVLRDNRLYQVAAIGTPEFVAGKDATAFLGSLDLTGK